uniref:Transmembrane protein 209 n=2 Tax=Parascaris univalens TaxID=6257 RepID=A0A915BX95_PARUN
VGVAMFGSPNSSVRSPSKVPREVIRATFEREAEMTRYRKYLRAAGIWAMVTSLLLLEVVLLRGFMLNFFLCAVFEFWKDYMAAVSLELPALVISAVNALYCTSVAIKSSLLAPHTAYGKLSEGQMRLLGVSDKEYQTPSQTPGSLKERSISSGTSHSDSHRFCFEWLSAIHFDSSLSHRPSPLVNEGTTAQQYSNNVSFADQSSISGNGSMLNITAYSDRSASVNRVCRSSSYSKPTSSIQTSKQLEKLLADRSLLDASSSSGPAALGSTSFTALSPRNTSFGSLYGSRRTDPTMGYRLFGSESSVYDLGTAVNSDENRKGTVDENGVVSRISGNRITMTPSRVSLSPIPLNLTNVSATQLTGDEPLLEGKSANNTSAMSSHISLDDSISFRVAVNARTKHSPKRSTRSPSPLTRRSESWERRRMRSVSPRQQLSDLSASFSSGPVAGSSEQLSPTSSSPIGKQYGLTSSEILNQYKLDGERFAHGERHLRSWICQTIIRPLVSNIDKMNEILTEEYPHLHLKVGRSSVEALQVALSSKGDLLCTVLPYLIPYLKVHEKQAYIVKRANELSVDVCMKEFDWQGGGSESLDKGNENSHSYSPPSIPWSEHLPTDAQLVWWWFCAYFDARMEANPMAADINMPFTSVFFLKKPNKPSAVQCHNTAFYVHQTSVYPPHFELVVDGGRERFEVGRGSRNLWRTILLFIQHARLFNNNRVGGLCIDENGINIACVVAEC